MIPKEIAKRLIRQNLNNKTLKILFKVIEPLLGQAIIRIKSGLIKAKESKPYIIVVSHDASSTGAPILALNICERLSEDFNILTIILRKGELIKDFAKYSTAMIYPKAGIITKGMIDKRIRRICRRKIPAYAIVNSAVSASTIQPIRKCGIPVLSLIHEFSAYIRPLSVIDNIARWSETIIFSSPLTRDDIVQRSPQIAKSNIKVLPQGKCIRGKLDNIVVQDKEIPDKAQLFLNSIDDDKILIIGAGAIQPRKGVDLFISVAAKIKKGIKNY